MKKDSENISREIKRLVRAANFSLRDDVKKVIGRAFREEKKKMPKQALGWLLNNAKIAKKNKMALCQDTGLPVVSIEVGKGAELTASLVDRIKKEVAKHYKKNYLRGSIVDPLLRGKPKYQGIVLQVRFSARFRGMKITLFPKGFGSENKTRLKMFNPTDKISQIEDFVLDSVKMAGPEGCPPFFIGVGIGGTADTALSLAKQALIGRVDLANPDTRLNIIEKRLLKKINRLNIGPMGFGGEFTALAVKIKKHPTHIAGLPVGVNISCHALRSATAKIKG